ncbi:MAG TPA: hypothetical protein VG734_04520 [Lacunisphaera sp.]|nr:hypothetical protein [Lacunisphaera sp.]
MNPTAVSRHVVAVAFAAAAGLVAGCSTSTYTVQVDAISQPVAQTGGAQPQSYYITSKNPRLDETSLRYKEVSDYVKTALSGKGMYEAPRPENADVVIDIDYGMDAPRVKFETISSPIIMSTGSRYETRLEQRTIRKPDGTIEVIWVEAQVLVPGKEEFLGMREEVTPIVVYEKFLKVSARENKEGVEGKAPAEVWSVNVSAEDRSQELRKYIPILASATADYIGTNTKESKPVRIDEKDDVVKFIKKGM